MIGQQTLIALGAAIAMAATAAAESPLATGIQQFRNAYRTWDQAGFWNATRSFQNATADTPKSATAHYWRGVAHFHRMLALRGNPTPRMQHIADHEMRSAIESLESATDLKPDLAEAHALLATLFGMKIGDSIVDAVRFGPSVHKHHQQALTHGPTNPRVQYLLGAALLHTADDEADRRDALKALQLAARLFTAEASKPAPAGHPRWGHDACLTFLGEAHASLNQPGEAAAAYRAALKLRPANRTAQASLRTLEHP